MSVAMQQYQSNVRSLDSYSDYSPQVCNVDVYVMWMYVCMYVCMYVYTYTYV
jgi:hypothetical protein